MCENGTIIGKNELHIGKKKSKLKRCIRVVNVRYRCTVSLWKGKLLVDNDDRIFLSRERISRADFDLIRCSSREMKLPARIIHHGGQRPSPRYEEPCQLSDSLREFRE